MSENAERPNERGLLERCLEGDQQAWKELVAHHERSLRLSIRRHLGDEAKDVQLVDDIGQEVWRGLFEKDQMRLRRYDPQQASFDTFLNSVAHQIIQERRRRQCRQKRKHREVGLGTHEPPDRTGNDGLAQAELAEYLAALTPQERRCLRENLLGMSGEVSGPPISPGNVRVLKHRLRKKGKEHLDAP